ncbi:MAG: Uma2 family endonuclease [Saprospiraceae bacterium]|nr:Uma2 family endonuclease [Saprospiraceae bacterium]
MIDVSSAEKIYTISECLAQEDASAVRHEFNNGNLSEMAGGILPHNVIKGEFYTLINLHIRESKIPHMVLNSDTKVRIEAQNRFVYPDLTITDGQLAYYRSPDGALRRDIVTNPLTIVEVLADDTRAYDKSDKFEGYAGIPGFREYILVEPETTWVKQYFLQDPANNLWQINTYTDPNARLPLQTLHLERPLAVLYSALEKLPKE